MRISTFIILLALAGNCISQTYRDSIRVQYKGQKFYDICRFDTCMKLPSDSVKCLTICSIDSLNCFHYLRNVEFLSIEGGCVIDSSILAFSNLKILWIWPSIKEFPAFLSKFSDLNTIILWSDISQWGTKNLNDLGKVNSLEIAYGVKFPKPLYTLPSLQYIELGGHNGRNIRFDKMTNLREVSFLYGKSKSIYKQLKSCKQLEYLRISSTDKDIDYDEILSFSNIKTLKRMDVFLSNRNIDNRSTSIISSLYDEFQVLGIELRFFYLSSEGISWEKLAQ